MITLLPKSIIQKDTNKALHNSIAMLSLPWLNLTISFLFFSLNFALNSSTPLCHPVEKQVLLQFRNSFTTNITGPMTQFCPYPVEIIAIRSSTTGDDCCKWNWINCDPTTGHVINIDLRCSGLNGSITRPIGALLEQLDHLQSLILSVNYLTGELPLSLGNDHNSMRLLDLRELNLASNSLYGEVPSWVTSDLPSLQTLSLGGNNFTGSLVGLLGNATTSLQEIGLSGNEFYGSIPNSMFVNLVNLTYLDLSSNKLSGSVKLVDVFSNLKGLKTLDLSSNSLSVVPTTSYEFESALIWPNMSNVGLGSCNLSAFPYLGFVENLLSLNLSSNDIQGEIPAWVLDMGRSIIPYHGSMWVDLSKNLLVGGLNYVPWDWLLYVDISSNLFQGELPISSINPQITLLAASNNKLNGTINHRSLCNLTMLQVLDLSNNSFSGEIPECLENMSPSLKVLNLGSNRLVGPIPRNFSQCDQLMDLDLSNNKLQGVIPRSLVHCKNLQVLNLANNKLDGVFPSWLDALPELRALNLRSNKLHGHVDHANTSTKSEQLFPKLQILDLSSNNFDGELPTRYIKGFKGMMDIVERPGSPQYMGLGSTSSRYFSIELVFNGVQITYVKIITTMALLDLSNNGFEGEIPGSIGGLLSLRGLNLSNNHLSGKIPASMGKLSLLGFLDLSSNRLSGEIPQELVSLTFLGVFNVSENKLVGLIPHGKNFDTFSADSYQGNPRLCGSPLPDCEGGAKTNTGSLGIENRDDDHEGEDTLLLWEIIMMGYGCGAFLGLVWGLFMLSLGKPFWFVKLASMLEVATLRFFGKRLGRRGVRRVRLSN